MRLSAGLEQKLRLPSHRIGLSFGYSGYSFVENNDVSLLQLCSFLPEPYGISLGLKFMKLLLAATLAAALSQSGMMVLGE